MPHTDAPELLRLVSLARTLANNADNIGNKSARVRTADLRALQSILALLASKGGAQ